MDYSKLVTATELALGEVLGRDPGAMTEETRLIEDLRLDSTSAMELLMAMEDSVGLVVDPTELQMEDFRTVGTFAAYADRRLSANGHGS